MSLSIWWTTYVRSTKDNKYYTLTLSHNELGAVGYDTVEEAITHIRKLEASGVYDDTIYRYIDPSTIYQALNQAGAHSIPVYYRVRFARASDPDGPNDRYGVTDGKSEGYICVTPPPANFVADHRSLDKEKMFIHGWLRDKPQRPDPEEVKKIRERSKELGQKFDTEISLELLREARGTNDSFTEDAG